MNNLTFDMLVFVGSMVAGFLGTMTGLGGGVVLVPLLVLGFGVDLRYAVGASLMAVIATSSGAAAAYVREGFSNVRIGMFLEVATTVGALAGAALAVHMNASILAVVFGAVLLLSAFLAARRKKMPRRTASRPHRRLATPRFKLSDRRRLDRLPRAPRAARLRLDGDCRRPVRTSGHRLGRFQSPRHGPGDAHSLQGVHHDQQLHDRRHRRRQRRGLPARGYIDPGLTFPVVLGVLAGAFLGARTLPKTGTHALRIILRW